MQTATEERLVLFADRLITTETVELTEDAVVVVEDGCITAAGKRAHHQARAGDMEIECGDRTLLPGLIDAHVHFFGVDTLHTERLFTEPEPYRALRAARDAESLLDAGFTSVRCLGSSIGPHLARAVDERVVRGPRIVAAGQFICSTTGTWDDVQLPVAALADADLLADGEDSCRAVVRRRIRTGAGVIKIGLSAGAVSSHFRSWGDEPTTQATTYALGEIEAVVAEAHRHGLKVSAHAIGDDAVRSAIAGSVDVIEHAHGITAQTRDLLAEAGVTVVPTLTHMYLMSQVGRSHGIGPDLTTIAERHLAAQLASFADLLAAGVTVAAGSDLIGPPWADMSLGATEPELMVRGGMSPADALRSSTAINAEVLGMAAEVGDLRPGMRADMIAVRGNPLTDIGALRQVDLVVKDGV